MVSLAVYFLIQPRFGRRSTVQRSRSLTMHDVLTYYSRISKRWLCMSVDCMVCMLWVSYFTLLQELQLCKHQAPFVTMQNFAQHLPHLCQRRVVAVPAN